MADRMVYNAEVLSLRALVFTAGFPLDVPSDQVFTTTRLVRLMWSLRAAGATQKLVN